MSVSTAKKSVSKPSVSRISHLFFFSMLCLFAVLSLVLPPQNASADQITLTWTPPTTNANGTPLTDLAGYFVYYGTASRKYSGDIPVGMVTTATISNLTDGVPYYFAVTAYDTAGNQSAYSNEVSKTLQTAVQQYTLTTSKLGSGSGTVTSSPSGISCGTSCSGSYNAGTVVTLTAAPGTGSTFSGWSGGGCAGTGICSFSLNASTTVTATFVVTTYSITATAGANGTITPSGTTTVNSGANQTYTITPNTGYTISGVTVDGSSVGAVSTYTFSAVTANHTIAATYAVKPSACTARTPSVSITPSSQTIAVAGGNVTYNVTIVNNDSGSSCTNTTFSLAPSDSNSTNFNASTVNPASVTLAAGANTTITKGLTVTAKAGQTSGTDSTSVAASASGHVSGISSAVITGITVSGDVVAGPNSPTAAVNNAAVGSRIWSNPTSVFSADNVYAVAGAMVNNQSSAYLVATGFGFAIPASSTITGIQVSVKRAQGTEAGSATIQDNSVKIVQGGAITGLEHAVTGTNWPTTNTAYTYGSSTDTWGATWTPATINAGNFGVAISAKAVASGSSYQDALVDYVSITVYYTQ